mgnify:FL=1
MQLNRAVMDEMEAVRQVLPVGYEVHTSYDATEYIREELDKIYFRTGLTVLILLVFVWLITRKLKYLFLIVTSLAVNIAVALIFYYLFGLEMQLYSLAGITVSLNLVIDSTIVMTDTFCIGVISRPSCRCWRQPSLRWVRLLSFSSLTRRYGSTCRTLQR